jgi:hypothetical protein
MSTDTVTYGTARAGYAFRQATPRADFADDPNRGCAPGKADPDAFFTDSTDGDRRVAARHCVKCPVRQACQDWAVATGQEHGVWGGLTRRQLRLAVAMHRQGLDVGPIDLPRASTPTLDERVAEMHGREMSDKDIAADLGVWKSTVRSSRNRQKLPSLYGPGGHRLPRAGAA